MEETAATGQARKKYLGEAYSLTQMYRNYRMHLFHNYRTDQELFAGVVNNAGIPSKRLEQLFILNDVAGSQ